MFLYIIIIFFKGREHAYMYFSPRIRQVTLSRNVTEFLV